MGLAVRQFLGYIFPHLQGSLALLPGFYCRCETVVIRLDALWRFSRLGQVQQTEPPSEPSSTILPHQGFQRVRSAGAKRYSPKCVE